MIKFTLIPFLVVIPLLCITAGISRSEDGLFQVEKQKFGVAYWSRDWKSSASQTSKPESVSFPGEGGEETPQGLRRYGTWRISEESQFQYIETVRTISENEIHLQLELKSSAGIPTSILAWTTLIPSLEYAANPAVFNGKAVSPSAKQQEFESKGKDELILNLRNGRLTLRGRFHLTVVPFSWGTEIRLRFPNSWGTVRSAKLNLHLLYTPYASRTIDLRSAANMGFRDEIADDRSGGWTDQGPGNDLRAMVPGVREFAGISFDIIDPAKNRGKSCLAMRGGARPYFLEHAALKVPECSGSSLFLLNGLAWAPEKGKPSGKVTVLYSDGSRTESILKCGIHTGNFWGASDLPEAPVVWKSRNDSSVIGLYATRIALDPKKKVSGLEFTSQNQVWMILAATVTNRGLEKQTSEAVVIRAGRDWVPLNAGFRTLRGSVADLSSLLDAPAGKYGFVKTNGDHFEFEKRPGIPVRFWGANICMEAIFMEKKAICGMLDDFASMGCNSIRLHHFDYLLTRNENRTGVFDPEKADRLDFLVAEAKKRGIYVTLDLLTIAQLGSMEKVSLAWKTRDYKTLCYFDPAVRKVFLEFAEKLFGHVNAYTGIAWKEDPVFVSVNLINEGTLPVLVNRMSDRVRPVVESAFRQYLERHGLSGKDAWVKHREAFLEETGKEFFSDVKQRLRAFGVRIPLSDQNFAEAAGDTRACFDYVDTHLYWGHPVFIGKNSWKLPYYTNPVSAIAANAGGIGDVFHVRVFGRPMTITEWGYCYPNPRNFEGPFLVAAYSALQDFSGLWQFCYSHAANPEIPKPFGSFDFHAHPVMKAAVRAGALMFLRGDVRTAPSSVSGTPEGIRAAGRTIALVTKIGRSIPGRKAPGVFLALPGERTENTASSVIRVKNTSDALRKLTETGTIPKHCVDLRNGISRSETGELILNRKQGNFRVVAPLCEALLMKAGQTLSGDFLSVRNGGVFAAFFAASLDRRPLKESGRILLMHLTDLKSDGAVFRDSTLSILEDEGTAKRLLRRNRAEIELRTGKAYRLFACAPDGSRLSEVPFQRKADRITFIADNASEKGGVLIYELLGNHSEKTKTEREK